MVSDSEDQLQQKIDATLQEWCQGDCVLGEQWFFHRFNVQYPLTDVSKDALDSESDLVESEVVGFAVVTQTCDIVRSCLSRPFLEVVPLVEVEQQRLQEIQRGRRPQYALIPNLAGKCLVADLDRVMTIEKAVAIKWQRVAGCTTDEERKMLGQALARKRSRFAFPNDFTAFVKKLQKRLQEKHDRESEEGEALRALREIRVHASPSWDASEIELMFLFIRYEDEFEFKGMEWYQLLERWLNLVPASGRFQSVEGEVTTLEALSAKAYTESDPLDLDHLSMSS
ncbi:MAG: hypothetical protein HC852_14875 [Acaryochloridaceae cyanobacterium RU_4_10]|nr:hypothetical protein [Acaryochloridaceae cyanobacterium RU_4_10]